MKLRRMVYMALAVSLITIGAFIKVPISIVPVTLQSMMVILTALFLPDKDGIKAVLLYIAIGLIGFPVFASGGGIAYVLVPSFGYILGFLIAAIFVATCKSDDLIRNIIVSLVATLLIYICGIAYFIVLQYFYYGKTFEMSWILWNLLLIYLPGDVITVVLANIIHQRLKKSINLK